MLPTTCRPIPWKRIAILFLLMLGTAAPDRLSYSHLTRVESIQSSVHSSEARHPSSRRPDNIVLTPSPDMSTSQSITWRTSGDVVDGVVQFTRLDDKANGLNEAEAVMTVLTSENLASDKTVHCHSAVLANLIPATTYSYRVGSRKQDAWSEYSTFTTAPGSPASFSFVYIGDTQAKPERVGKMLKAIEKRHPEASFYMIGGDLVNIGDSRNRWDDLLANAGGVFSRKSVAPAMGNHDFGDQNFGAAIYNAYFKPSNRRDSQAGAVPNYSFRYGDAFFIVINSLDVSAQTEWLERELRYAAESGHAFKAAMFHRPVYNPRKGRTNSTAKKQWVPLFDKYGVDLVLTGHDHSYMRSKPLRAGKAVADGEFGTVYVVATGCDKFYDFERLDIAEVQFTNTATYQVITVGAERNGNRTLRYTSYDAGGNVMDAFESVRP